MERKDFKILYTALTNLYGVIHSNLVYELLTYYHKEVSKEELYKDLKNMVEKSSKDYWVREIERSEDYIIQKERLSDKELDEIIEEQANHNLYIPNSYEKLLEYAINDPKDPSLKFDDSFDFNEALDFFKNNVKKDSSSYDSLYLQIVPLAYGEGFSEFKFRLEKILTYKEDMDKEEFERVIANLLVHRKYWIYFGNSMSEILLNKSLLKEDSIEDNSIDIYKA